jgi:hypothetical protein
MKRLLAPAAGLLAATSLPAAAEVHVTVYNENLALVREVRTVEVPSGEGELAFGGVSERIDPTSVRLTPASGLVMLEQNYRYDLVSREKLLERYLDRSAQVVTKHDKFHEGVLKSAAGSLILETADGVVVISQDEVADIKLPEIPEGLITRPTLVWRLDNSGDTERDLEVAYLTGGLSWHAEYVAAVSGDDTRMDLSGWVSLENNSGATYENAHLKVVAGDVNRVQDRVPVPKHMERMMAMAADGDGFEQREFFEYHLYDLGRPTTLADREIKQIRLLEDREVGVEKLYVYEPTRGNQDVQVKLDFENAEKNGLGVPLPGGKVRVYREDAGGALEFAGEDRIDHTPRDEKVSLSLGNAFDLVGERNELEARRISTRITERTVEIKLRNRKREGSVTIEVREHPGGDWEVLEASHEWEKPKADDLVFEVPVKAGEEVVVNYRVRSQF